MKETEEKFISILLKIADRLGVSITDYIADAYEKAIKNLIEFWQGESPLALNLLLIMKEKKSLFSIPDTQKKGLSVLDLNVFNKKAEDFMHIQSALTKIEVLVNAGSDREALEKQLMAILDSELKKLLVEEGKEQPSQDETPAGSG